MGGFSFTAVHGWVTPILPSFLNDDLIQMTPEEASWMVSIPEITNLISPIPAAILADRIGRKPVILMSAPMFSVGWAMILYFRTYWSLMVARLIQGAATGIVLSVVPVYVGEIASTEHRGAITSLFFILSWVGYLFEYTTGPFLSFTNYTSLTLATSVLFFILFVFQPESPHFYTMKGNLQSARRSLEWLRFSSDTSIDEELEKIIISVEEDKLKKTSLREVVETATDRRALYILLFVGWLRVMCGVIPVVSYATEIFEYGSNLQISAVDATILLGVVLVAGSLVSFFTIDTLGRRFLLISSCLVCSVCLCLTSVFYYLEEKTDVDVTSFTLIPPVTLLVFAAVAVAGLNPVNTAYTSELFNSKTRSVASSISVIFATAWAFLVLKFYQNFVDWFGVYSNFLFYCIICACGAIISFSYMPETKNKPFHDIRNEL